MKFVKLNKAKLFFLGLTAMVATSCQNTLDINRDPDLAPSATVDLVLPAAQVEMGLTVGNTWNYVGSMWGQYWTGGYGVSTANLEFYNMTNTDVETAWTRAYARTLEDLDFLRDSEEPIYAGMAKIMMGYLFQMLVDLHGDVPFTEALQGSIEEGSILIPAFDSEQDIYAALIPMIEEGIADIQQSGGLIQEPGSDDLMYNGDLDQWERFANTIILKILVRSGQYSEARNWMNNATAGFIGDGDDAMIQYFETTKNTNPLYARFASRIAVGMYYVATSSSVDAMVALGDPRINEIYITGNAGHEGVVAGDINENTVLYPPPGPSPNNRFDRPSTATFNPDVPVFFISEWESYFLQAETLIRAGEDGTAMFLAATEASFDYYGLSAGDAATYFATLGFDPLDPIDDQIDILAVQKWISMNGLQMAEGWLETLRFDRPGHHMFTNGIFTSPTNNALGSFIFPTSFVYPTQEVALNPNTPARTVTDQRFWDN